jgi:hypothetical protein
VWISADGALSQPEPFPGDKQVMETNNLESKIVRLSLSNYNRSVDHVVNRRDRYDLNPPYQRGSVWDTTRRRNLIKSLLIGLPVGTITLNDRGYCPGGKDMAVVDGKQRIETLWAFVDSGFAIPADWLHEDKILETERILHNGLMVTGVRFSGTSKLFRRQFSNLPIQMIESTVEGLEAEAEIFLLINSGGVAQTADDLANAEKVRTASPVPR